LLERFKCLTRAVENPVLTSIGATAAVVLANNPNRLAWVFVNLSVNAIYIALANDVSATKGIYVPPSGTASMVWDEDFQMVGWAIWAIAPAGASACYSIEVVTQ
jgi:hypothetical protein